MPKLKVRHALITWTEEKNGGTATETAFRGMIVDIPSGEQLDKLQEHGAVIAEDVELDRPGIMLELRDAPSDEELINWVIGATPTEVEFLVRARPSMVDRIANIQEVVSARYKEQNKLLGQAAETASEIELLPPEPVMLEPDATEGNLDAVVRGSVGDVTEFLSDNPEQAPGILEAESRRAAERNQAPRPGILNAVQAAVSHTTS